MQPSDIRHRTFPPRWITAIFLAVFTYAAAFWLRMMEWPSWQEVEYRLGNELLLATHDAYHWVAGAEGFSFGVGHPMSELLRVLALFLGQEPATVAFWLPPVMASLVAVLVFAWATCMGSMEAGVCAGILASLAPGFLARTLLGYSDTDLVTLFLPLLIGLAPACWVMRFLRHPLALPLQLFRRPLPVMLDAPGHVTDDLLAPHWIILLTLSGVCGWWAQQWHSLFPYLAAYNVGLLGMMTLCLAAGQADRRAGLLAAVCYALPLMAGPAGLIPGALLVPLRVWRQTDVAQRILGLLVHPVGLMALWVLTGWLLVQGDIFNTMAAHIQGYLKRGGDPSSSGDIALIFPSVAQSIIEIQDLSIPEMLVYFHPWPHIAVLGFCGFFIVVCARSGALFLLPMVALAILSTRMGGRMIMFGAPIIALGLVLPVDWLACWLGDVQTTKAFAAKTLGLRRKGRRTRLLILFFAVTGMVGALLPDYALQVWDFWMELGPLRLVILSCLALMLLLSLGRHNGWNLASRLDAVGPHLLYRAASVTLMLVLVIPPLAELIPAMTHGPIINRRHAGALRALQKATPEDAMLWMWWDWGYAAHHFARRETIADGAEHGGPSLYLPAAVFSTDSPRFARQIIKYTALHDNVPGDVFRGLNAEQADALMKRLANPDFPLVNAPGKQYVVVSYDMLNLGFWISTFGNWDFLKREGRGYAISIVPQQLSYRLDRGQVLVKGSNSTISAASLDIFEDGRLVHRNYTAPPAMFPSLGEEQKWRDDVEQRRNIHFLFNRVTGEKLVVDDRMYNTLMIRLLIGPPNAPAIAPYFRLIYDNVFCRVYEVL